MKVNILKKYWYVFVLLGIVAFSFYIRSFNIVPDRILSFDPVFMYRQTYYMANWGHLPVWDEISYYVGKIVDYDYTAPLMFYITTMLYWLLQNFGMSLLTTSALASAFYGAIIAIPAFLLVKELSNEYGGLFSAILVASAPQVLVRTFGSSYDTDQLVLFFILLTMFAGVYALKRKTISSICLALISFSCFMLTWTLFSYTYAIMVIAAVIFIILSLVLKNLGKTDIDIFKEIKGLSKVLVALLIGLIVIGFLTGVEPLKSFRSLMVFSQNPETWIVNISIAELQPFSIFELGGWILAMGRFSMGDGLIDSLIFLVFILLISFGFYSSYKKNKFFNLAFLMTLFVVGLYTTVRGIRFTEFTSVIFISMIGYGFGMLMERIKNHEKVVKSFFIGGSIFLVLIIANMGLEMGKGLGPDMSPNWDAAWNFLKTETPENSIVGTWWDPGHMINGLAERRNFADGAHCTLTCLYTINDRITDLGKIMVTSNENESLELIRKYQGTSPKVYWIASDDLIGKFRWLQYFGTGCDGVSDESCPLYIQLGESSRSTDNNGNLMFRNYDMGQQTQILVYNTQPPIPMLVQGINIALFKEIITYNGTEAISITFTEEELNSMITALKPLEGQLNARFVNETIQMTAWLPAHYSYIVLIPPTLRDSVFTKMFMLEGQGLEHFEQVFRNEQVKIYEVV
ncbi:MAG: STT3 domain-containing protein [Candidatus Aenigmatarchaeota archaeon]